MLLVVAPLLLRLPQVLRLMQEQAWALGHVRPLPHPLLPLSLRCPGRQVGWFAWLQKGLLRHPQPADIMQGKIWLSKLTQTPVRLNDAPLSRVPKPNKDGKGFWGALAFWYARTFVSCYAWVRPTLASVRWRFRPCGC